MSKSSTIQINPYSAKMQVRRREKEDEKIRKLNEQKSFQDRMRGLINFIYYVVLPLLISWSIITEVAFAGTEFYLMTNSLWAAVILTLLIVSFVEISKIAIGKMTIRFFSQGWIFDGAHYILFFIPVLIWFVIAYGGSIYMSTNAGQPVAKNISKWVSPPPPIPLDKINADFDSRIDPYLATIAAAEKTTWKGRIVEEAREIIKNNQNIIDGIEAQRVQAIQLAINQSDKTEVDQEADMTAWGSWLNGFGGMGEGLQLCCLIMICIYFRVSYDEKVKELKKQEENITQHETPTQQSDTDSSINRIEVAAFGQSPYSTQTDLQKQLPQAVATIPETIVQHGEEAVPTLAETNPPVATKTSKRKVVKTVVVKNSNARYLKQRYKQSYRRSKKQDDPTTPLNNMKKFGKQLTALGYTMTLTEEEVKGKTHYDVIFEKQELTHQSKTA